MVPAEGWLETLERADLQQEVIYAQRAVLEQLGFDSLDVLEAHEPPPPPPPRKGRFHRAVSYSSVGYLALNTVSTKVPGPAWYLGLAPHVRLLAHCWLALKWLG